MIILKKSFFVFATIFCFINCVKAQDTVTQKYAIQKTVMLTEETIVKDSLGQILPYSVWTNLLSTGDYNLKLNKNDISKTSHIIYKLTDAEKQKRLKNIDKMPSPRESKFFKTGEAFSKINTRDINGNKINTKKLNGKIIVLNYWFTNCMPCVKEIPELNAIVEKYQNDSSVVFISIALDEANVLENFLKLHPFKYSIIDNGRFFANNYNINTYPTHVVIDKKGLIYFHTSGLAPNTALWIAKSIEELKASKKE